MIKNGETIVPDFIEEEFISAMDTYLNNTYVYPKQSDKPLIKISRISQSKERELGYDGIITSIIPFYVQFKRSNFYTPNSTSLVINDRKKLNLETRNGVYFFPLHKNGLEFDQHNTMFNLANHSFFKKKVFYAAPLFFRKNQLEELRRGNDFAYRYSPIHVYDNETGSTFFHNRFPIFKNVITIPPHRIVNRSSEIHKYSYTKQGEVCFHSDPEIYPDSNIDQDFDDFLLSLYEEEAINNIDSFSKHVIEILPKLFGFKFNSPKFKSLLITSIYRSLNYELKYEGLTIEKLIDLLTPLDKLVVFEDVLKSHFNIHQYVRYTVLDII